MSVPEQTTPFSSSAANGVTTVFPYGFMIASVEDLAVEVDGVPQPTGYTVSGVGNPSGGNVTFSVAPANGSHVLRYLKPKLKRDNDYPQFGDLPSPVLNLDFDRIWLALQALVAQSSRSIKLPVDTPDDQLISVPATTRAGKLVGFDENGNATLFGAADVPLATVTPFILTLLNDINAEEARATLGVLAKFDANGTADAMTGTVAPSIITDYTEGLRVTTTPPGANTLTAPTIALNGLPPKIAKKRDSGGTKVALAAGDYNASGPFDFEYDGTDFILLNPLASSSIPSGAVIYFAASSAPTGFIKANGAAVSRTTYAALFAAIGTTFGAGDGSTTFNVPDLRAEFIRGLDDGRGVDSGRALGSAQSDDFKSHSHEYNGSTLIGLTVGGTSLFANFASNTSSTGGAETRPRNVALLACIKY